MFKDAQCLDPKNLGDALFFNPNRRLLLFWGERSRAQLRSDGWICSELKQGRRTQCQYSQKKTKRNPGSIDDKNALKESSRGSFKLCISRLANHIWNYKCLWSLSAVVRVILNADLNLEDKMWLSCQKVLNLIVRMRGFVVYIPNLILGGLI